MKQRTTVRWAALLSVLALASCVGSSDSPEQGSAAIRYCPEPTWPDFRGDPRNAAGYIRYCWPGEAACYCDRDNDCYALDGYVSCVNPPDGGTDAAVDGTADQLDAADVADRLDAADADRLDAADVADADRLDAADAADADRLDAADAADRLDAADVADADRLDAADVADADRLDAADAAADRADADAVVDAAADRADADAATDAADASADGPKYCPESVTPDFRGDPRNAAGYIRYCWPGETACYCDRDNDCYRLSGYVPCLPPGTVLDASTDAGMDAPSDATLDAAQDAADAARDATDAGNVCPGPTITGSNGQPYDPVTLGLRQCFPGEAHCFCDVWNDCYAQSGYVACTRTDAGVYNPGTCADAGAPASDAGALPVDPIAYTGTFSNAPGYHFASLTVAGLARDVWYYVPFRTCARPALLLAFHGATGNGNEVMQQMDAQYVAERVGAVVFAPSARFMSAAQGDFSRPEGNAIYWETWPNHDPNTNPDLMLVRAIMKEAQRALNADPDRTYATGYSNGGFMTINVAVALHDRVAAWATTNSGMVPCMYRLDCNFTGTALTCGGLATQPGYCNCTGPDKPTPLPATFRRPAFLSAAVEDTTVSVYYTCTLDQRLSALGVAHTLDLVHGTHYPRDNFLTDAWAFMSRYVR